MLQLNLHTNQDRMFRSSPGKRPVRPHLAPQDGRSDGTIASTLLLFFRFLKES
jgi:hypothetical protein